MHIPLPKLYSGKVRDLYQLDESTMLMVASDRLSAFDVVFQEEIPRKGEILTEMSKAWFGFFRDLIPNHLTNQSIYAWVPSELAKLLEARALIVKKLQPIKIEAVVRGYLAGGAWKEYQQTGTVGGILLPKGLSLAEALPEIIFTPSTKAPVGGHDETIDFQTTVRLIGEKLAQNVKDCAITLYKKASEYVSQRGILLADTKFEFGLDQKGELTLMDEVLTPDSSRFWDLDTYQVGQEPDCFDKQYIRNWLEHSGWNKKTPPPRIPPDVIQKTQELYQTIFQRLWG
ncbi:MAG: phosphoribosylaminoimidazolesuccinocarboxamide synthase [Neisseriaceae bacterium]